LPCCSTPVIEKNNRGQAQLGVGTLLGIGKKCVEKVSNPRFGLPFVSSRVELAKELLIKAMF
jgi:hypothetical protein